MKDHLCLDDHIFSHWLSRSVANMMPLCSRLDIFHLFLSPSILFLFFYSPYYPNEKCIWRVPREIETKICHHSPGLLHYTLFSIPCTSYLHTIRITRVLFITTLITWFFIFIKSVFMALNRFAYKWKTKIYVVQYSIFLFNQEVLLRFLVYLVSSLS